MADRLSRPIALVDRTASCHVMAGSGDGWAAFVLVGCRVLGLRTVRGRAGMARAAAMLVAVAAVGACTTSCGGAAPHVQTSPVRLAARIRLPASATSVLAGAPDVVAEGVARRLFVS